MSIFLRRLRPRKMLVSLPVKGRSWWRGGKKGGGGGNENSNYALIRQTFINCSSFKNGYKSGCGGGSGSVGLSVCANSPINVNLQRQLVSYVGERIPLLTQSYLGFRSLCLSVSSYEWPVRGREKEKNEFIWERRMWTKVL